MKKIIRFDFNLHFRWPFSYILSWPFTSQYINALKTRGNQKLTERKRVLTLTGETPVSSKLFKLGEDYWLGDVVTIKSELFNLRKESTITSIKKTYDHTGLYIEPIFGKETPTVYDILGR